MRTVIGARDERTDRGAVLPWIGIMLVMLMGFGVIVIDVGALYKEKRELQNGADAAALAVAKDCAGPGESCLMGAAAPQFANDNAGDGASNIDVVCGVGPDLALCSNPPAETAGFANWVMVTTSTSDGAGGTKVDYVLAPVLDAALDGGTVDATAIAAWGPLGRANTLALTFSVCEYEAAGGSLEDGTFPTTPVYIYFHGDTELAGECGAGPSGADLPGGFGWLDESDCEAEIDDESWVGDDPGASAPNPCRDILQSLVDNQTEILIPLYDNTNGLSGNNGEYHIAGFVGFQLLGYRFPGEVNPPGFSCDEGPGNSATCIRGEFREVVEGGNGEFGDIDFGATLIKMIG